MGDSEAMNHTTEVRHLTNGWLRWQAVCTCGWTGSKGGQLQAECEAEVHRETHIFPSHTCYDVASMEYAPEGHVCRGCVAEAARSDGAA